jgi:nucleotide-binding universal stress UspA family protein
MNVYSALSAKEPCLPLRLNRILAPTDFSKLSDLAVDVAINLAAQRPAVAVTLLHVLETVPSPRTVDCDNTSNDIFSHRVDKAEKEMHRLRSAHGAHADLSTRVLVGNVADDICKVAKDEQFDLIVLSSHGLTGLPEVSIGNVAERILHEAPCPVLVVKPPKGRDGRFLLNPFRLNFKRLLVGFDHRSRACHALEVARSICRDFHGHITLVEALDVAAIEGMSTQSGIESRPSESLTPELQKLRDGLERLRTEHLPESIEWEMRVAIGLPWEVITKAVKDTGSDLIIVGPHEYTQWGHAFDGSTVQQVVHHAPCSVLLVR